MFVFQAMFRVRNTLNLNIFEISIEGNFQNSKLLKFVLHEGIFHLEN